MKVGRVTQPYTSYLPMKSLVPISLLLYASQAITSRVPS